MAPSMIAHPESVQLDTRQENIDLEQGRDSSDITARQSAILMRHSSFSPETRNINNMLGRNAQIVLKGVGLALCGLLGYGAMALIDKFSSRP
jgi:hypothetical protein